jgi:translation initiation factor 1
MAEKRPAPTRLVYSTRPGAVPAAGAKPCKHCGAAPCRCEPPRSLPPAEQDVRVRHERRNRGGKTVTVAAPVVLTRTDAAALLDAWKRLCGGGGTLRTARLPDGDPCFEIEVQGDHTDRLLADLQRAGYRAKRVGGGAGAVRGR